MTKRTHRKSPQWLQPMWAHKRAETVQRVTAAVRALQGQAKPVTLAAIRQAILELTGISISTNTIQRNELAYEVYCNNASAGPATRAPRDSALAALQRAAPPAQRPAVRAKIARLRRQSKDTLIAKLIELETAVEDQVKRENALREELLRVTLTPTGRSHASESGGLQIS
jgi:hypothetical protein